MPSVYDFIYWTYEFIAGVIIGIFEARAIKKRKQVDHASDDELVV